MTIRFGDVIAVLKGRECHYRKLKIIVKLQWDRNKGGGRVKNDWKKNGIAVHVWDTTSGKGGVSYS